MNEIFHKYNTKETFPSFFIINEYDKIVQMMQIIAVHFIRVFITIW